MKARALNSSRSRATGGFTLIELLMMIVTVAVLAALLIPALARSRPDSQVFRCMNNTRQLTLAWLMFPSDHNDALVSNPVWAAGSMDWAGSGDNFNSAKLVDPAQSLMGEYVKNPALFKCPADTTQPASYPGPRVRSYSLNIALRGPVSLGMPGTGINYFAPAKLTDLVKPGPAKTWAILDEHADSINDSVFGFNPGYIPSAYAWRDLPASYHNGAGVLSFTDGHSEVKKWQDARTVQPVRMQFKWWSPPGNFQVPLSVDYAWMNEGMPYRE